MKFPKVSVIMPVYNGEKFVRDAIDSILSQTFPDFELIIINDGSSDSSEKIISLYNDSRIIFINNEMNTGLPNVRNQGLRVSRGQYIAWLDCDDTSVSDRLEKQVKLFDGNPRVGVCGAWIKIIGDHNEKIVQFPTTPSMVRAKLLFDNCLANSTVMMRAACTREIGLRFEVSHCFSQDYGLWVRIPKHWEITNIPEVLTIYRLHSNQVSVIYKQKQLDIAWNIQKGLLSDLGIFPTEDERVIHMSLSGLVQNTFENSNRVLEARDYINKLYKSNQKNKIYDKKAFREILLEKWLLAANRSNGLSIKLTLASFWMRFKLDGVSVGLLWRAIKRMWRIMVEFLG